MDDLYVDMIPLDKEKEIMGSCRMQLRPKHQMTKENITTYFDTFAAEIQHTCPAPYLRLVVMNAKTKESIFEKTITVEKQ